MDPNRFKTVSLDENRLSPKPSPNYNSQSDLDAPNVFVRYARKLYNPIGFRKGYNFTLFFIFAGAMMFFSITRFPRLNITGPESTSYFSNNLLAERYWMTKFPFYKMAITLHLASALPLGFLMVFQFIPMIRYKALIVHRINGYIVITLAILCCISALMLMRRSFGGGLEVQAAGGTAATMIIVSLFLAYYNIKNLQIEQHRKWMLRAMFYLGIIITQRIFILMTAMNVDKGKEYWTAVECGEIEYGYVQYAVGGSVPAAQEIFRSLYPMCVGAGNVTLVGNFAAVQGTPDGMVESVSVGYKLTFGMTAWLAIILHMVGVEVYLALTPRETERLRKVSYERQLARGYKNPGRGGLTADRFGDSARWRPEE
ncbi:hypothetical protein ABW20_dc0103893 [Dactylellina cionopaga]|nr:hypothetical protein ABW20_dc0103893 [Dactylellina cionopaga]